MEVDFASAPGQPVLDVEAESDFAQVHSAVALRAPKLPRDGCSRHITIAATDHYMANRRHELTAAIVPFLYGVIAGRC